MFWTGCGADANPLPRGKVELCEQYGKELADATTRRHEGRQADQRASSRRSTRQITLKFESVRTREQLNADLLSKTLAIRKRAERLLKELDATGKIADKYPYYPVQTWAIGDQVLLVALGGEVVIDYLLRLKKEVPTTRACG